MEYFAKCTSSPQRFVLYIVSVLIGTPAFFRLKMIAASRVTPNSLKASSDVILPHSCMYCKTLPKQVENAGFKGDILQWMQAGEQYAVADITKGVPSIVAAGISANRVTAMLTQLVNDGAVVRDTDKRKSVYRLA